MALRVYLGMVLLVGAAGGAGGCGGAASHRGGEAIPGGGDDDVEAFASPNVGLCPGEAMTFDVSVGGVPAGEAALAVGEPGRLGDRDAIVVSSRVASAGALRWVREIEDALTSTIDLATGLPIEIAADVVFGAQRYHARGQFAGPRVHLVWHKGDGDLRHLEYDFRNAPAHDAHTAMAAMRGWEADGGETRRLYVIGGRRVWRTDVTWSGRETIGTRLGNQAAVRLDGTSQRVRGDLTPEPNKPARRFSVWMSDDADRVPLRVIAYTELGDVAIELAEYHRP